MPAASSYTQSHRMSRVSTPLGEDVLLLRSMSANERLSTLFEFELDLFSENDQIHPADLLGQSVTVRLDSQPDQPLRYFNGHVSRFAQVGFEGRLARYQATLVPWLWFLTRTSDCHIFQQMTVPDILEQVFRDAGFTDFDNRLSDDYRTREYCVQYRETHCNFVCRLMEQEGIYWYFVHEDGKHTLVLADGYGAHETFSGYEEIAYLAPDEAGVTRDYDTISLWSLTQEVRSGAFVQDDFNFTKPGTDLRTSSSCSRSHAHAEGEIYDYPGEYEEIAEGERYAGVRMEQLQSDHEIVQGHGDVRGLTLGHLFTLKDFPRDDQNREYLVRSTSIRVREDECLSGGESESGEALFQVDFTAMNAQEPFRAPRLAPRPVVQGPQTAMVVGPGGEEIWTDEYGRVKLQFHWDRYGQNDENSSCWVRVSQLWAGNQWGGVHLPRIGQEVIVDFLEGDPDRPIVTGRVYNDDSMPPYPLPANQTRSGIKSRSSKGGGSENFNEFRFEDKKGEEEVYLHAERDLTTVVELNETRTIKDGDRTQTLEQGNETLTIEQGDRTETLNTGSDTLTLKQGDYTRTLKLGSDTLKVDLGDVTVEAPVGTCSVSAMQVKIEGTTSVKLTCGGSSIEITPASIRISAPMVQINGSGMVMIQGGLVKVG